MTDISVFSQPIQFEDLSWDLSGVDSGYVIGGTLDASLFTAGQHYPNGYLPSGTVLGKVTASGLWGPYLGAASDGRQTAVAILRASVRFTRYGDGSLVAKVGAAGLVHGKVSVAKLPFTSGNAAAGGYIDAAAQTALKNIYFAA